ncbi:unnamed protein product, partial [Mesorhabditis spiculigera]
MPQFFSIAGFKFNVFRQAKTNSAINTPSNVDSRQMPRYGSETMLTSVARDDANGVEVRLENGDSLL